MTRFAGSKSSQTARRGVLALAVVLVLSLAGCTGGEPSQAQAAGGSGTQNTDVTVDMIDMEFAPATVRVKVGDTVTWVNLDAVGHTVTPSDKAQWGSPGSGDDRAEWMEEGDSWSFRFSQPGTYDYYCLPHASQRSDGAWAGMVGTVVVT